mmetsp:Transcript_14566/g.39916  ORF Transcript_14566/g.39916 Transcript_14566/m.39916 type:complete len:109 (+) Transcript_14566:53-379(+)
MSALRVLGVAASRTLALRAGVSPVRPVSRAFSLYQDINAPFHKSDAQQRIDQVPPIEVAGKTALCDGGGGATGHPIEYIKLDRRQGRLPETCKYCGLRYIMKEGFHGH